MKIQLKFLLLLLILFTVMCGRPAPESPVNNSLPETNYQWTRTFGASSYDEGNALVVVGGKVYLTGSFMGAPDFNTGSGSQVYPSQGDNDIFLSCFNTNGTFVWTKTIGGTSADYGYGLTADSAGNLFLTGMFSDIVNFNTDGGADSLISSGGFDTFVTRINADGSYGWTRAMGGTAYDKGNDIAVDGAGNVYVCGYFSLTNDFNAGAGGDLHISNGSGDIFLTRLDSSGNYTWTKTMGSIGDDEGRQVAVDQSGNVYLAGTFTGTVDFNPGGTADEHTSNGLVDAFITRINADGSYAWTKTFGGSGADYCYGLVIDTDNTIYLCGDFQGNVDLDPGVDDVDFTSNGNSDIFILKLDSNGLYSWAKTVGGADADSARSITVDNDGDVCITGYFQGSVDFNPEGGVDTLVSAGDADIFLMKIKTDGSYVWSKAFGGSLTDNGRTVVLDDSSGIYLSGFFHNSVDFYPDNELEDMEISNGFSDIFISKYK